MLEDTNQVPHVDCRIVGYFAEEVYIFVKYGNVILNFADN